MKIKSIIFNTFKEASRNKVFYLLAVVGIVFAFASELTSVLTVGNRIKVLKDTGLAAIHFFSVLLTIFTGINLIFKEIDKKTIYNILSKPISRSRFVMGKFLGLAFTLLVALTAMIVIFSLFLYLAEGIWDPSMMWQYLLIYFELLIIVAFGLLFSSFATPISSSIFIICIFIVGHITWSYNIFKDLIRSPSVRFLTTAIYYIFPNLEKFNIRSDIALQTGVNVSAVLTAILYAVLYITAVLSLTILIFNKKELK